METQILLEAVSGTRAALTRDSGADFLIDKAQPTGGKFDK
jgi:hypothetical protein